MTTANKLRIGILGASGYTGAELLRLLALHPGVEIRLLTADRQAGKPLAEIFPHLGGLELPSLVKIEEADWSKVDFVFCCLPHGTTQEVIASLPRALKVVDLSADFRLTDIATYAEWYGHEHRAPELQREAVYGLTEIERERIRPARLIVDIHDLIWDALYAPLASGIGIAADRLNRLQFLTIRQFLTLVFCTLVILLLVLAIWS